MSEVADGQSCQIVPFAAQSIYMGDTNPGTTRLLTSWQTWQYAQSLSRRTVEERSGAVARMSLWCNTPPECVTVDQIAAWLAQGEWAASTRTTYYTALTAWFLWLQVQEHRIDNPMVKIGKPKRPRGEPRPISNADLCRILGIRMNRRTRAMILLAAFAGLRVHEIAKLRGEHLDLVDRRITVAGKGGVTVTLPLHHRIVEHAYAAAMPRSGWWFPGSDRGHQRRESVGGSIKDVMVRASVQGSAHQLRHWFGSELLANGVDLRVVQELMRHASVASTQIYTRVTDQRRIAGIDSLDPARPRISPASPLRTQPIDMRDLLRSA